MRREAVELMEGQVNSYLLIVNRGEKQGEMADEREKRSYWLMVIRGDEWMALLNGCTTNKHRG
jgi:hypothetical protein